MKIIFIAAMVFSLEALAQKCVVVKGGKETEFTGQSLENLKVEKKSLDSLNTLFPALSVQEKVFSGSIPTCVACEDNYVKCM